MLEVLHDRNLIYGYMIRDIYNTGLILERKFNLLRVSYLIFLIGLVVSIALYVTFLLVIG